MNNSCKNQYLVAPIPWVLTLVVIICKPSLLFKKNQTMPDSPWTTIHQQMDDKSDAATYSNGQLHTHQRTAQVVSTSLTHQGTFCPQSNGQCLHQHDRYSPNTPSTDSRPHCTSPLSIYADDIAIFCNRVGFRRQSLDITQQRRFCRSIQRSPTLAPLKRTCTRLSSKE